MNMLDRILDLEEKGEGFTLNAKTDKAYKGGGYAVSISDGFYDYLQAKKAIYSLQEEGNLKIPLYLGGWLDTNIKNCKGEKLDDQFKYDITIIIKDLETAKIIAKVFKQKAIYDFKTGKSIYI